MTKKSVQAKKSIDTTETVSKLFKVTPRYVRMVVAGHRPKRIAAINKADQIAAAFKKLNAAKKEAVKSTVKSLKTA